ncbi:MAG: DUF3817 domain-containing protein [Verrucomicrobiales bacterium]
MTHTSLNSLRLISLAEALSYLYLLYAAIYEKRILGHAEAIRTPGMIHGVLFVLFVAALIVTWRQRRWPLKRAAFAFLCSLIPFAPFYLEHLLKKEAAGENPKS